MKKHGFSISEFTVAPQILTKESELPYHEWMIEFEDEPEDLQKVAADLDVLMQKQNSYYRDLITGKVLQPLKITKLNRNSFNSFMKSQGKLGGQNKVPRLANDRKIADALLKIQI
jgi:hypothetical protein